MARIQLVDGAVLAAETYITDPVGIAGATYLLIQVRFVAGTGGTTVDVFVQTSVDGGTVWADVAQFAFTTSDATAMSKVSAAGSMAANYAPTDGTLTDNTVKDGLIGGLLRAKYVVVGDYEDASLAVYAEAKN